MAGQAPFPTLSAAIGTPPDDADCCLMLLQKPESARENACEWYTNSPATWFHDLRQFRKRLALFGLRKDFLPPHHGHRRDTARGTIAFTIKKRAPASLEPVCFFMVGMARFERAASASRTLRSSQTEPHPVAREDITPKACRMQAFFSKKFFSAHVFCYSFLPGGVPDMAVHVLCISGN